MMVVVGMMMTTTIVIRRCSLHSVLVVIDYCTCGMWMCTCLFQNEHGVVEKLLKFLIGVVDAKLLEGVELKIQCNLVSAMQITTVTSGQLNSSPILQNKHNYLRSSVRTATPARQPIASKAVA